NLKAYFNGSLNLNNQIPEFNFDAQVTKINLNSLNFTKDTLILSGNVESDIVGNNLNNIIGSLLVSDLSIQKIGYSTYIDSLLLYAAGEGEDRTLAIESSILEATINGQFDLNTFPSYFKSVAKRYLPSWETEIVAGGPQEFNMELTLKDF